jgi:hypothetical protein
MTFTYYSLHNQIGTPQHFIFAPCLFFASLLMTSRFTYCRPPVAMICTNFSIDKGLAGASTRIIAFFAPWDRHDPPLQLIIGTHLKHALPDFLAIHTSIIGKVPVAATKSCV